MATSDIGKAEFLNVKNKDTGEVEKKTLIPLPPSDGDLGGISEEELAQITTNKENISSLRENLVVRQKEQPTNPNNNVWISDEDDEVEVPDMGEFNSLKEDKVDKPSANDDGKIPRAKEGSVEWVEVGQPTDEQTNNAVTSWLNEHPEATTTVQDGSIEEIKINKNFLPYIKKDYVTPEMFGAVGDGKTDDTNAVQQAINYSIKNSIDFVGEKNYKTTSTILIKDSMWGIGRIYFIGDISYSGNECAVRIQKCSYTSIYLCGVYAKNGNGIEFYSNQDYCRYVELRFCNISVKNKAIVFTLMDNSVGFLNENRIYGGQISGGVYGIYADAKKSATRIESNKFYNIGIEGSKKISYGFYFVDDVYYTSIINPRYGEGFDKLIKTVGHIPYIQFIGNNNLNLNIVDFSSETYGHIISPIKSTNGEYIDTSARIYSGIVIPTKCSRYINLNDENVDWSVGDYIANTYNFVLVNDKVKSIKLPPTFGNRFGLNQFIMFFSRDASTELTIYDSEGNVILNTLENVAWNKCKFTYNISVGWVVEIMDVKTVITR